ncbi:MAG: (E)-4-hydroxy-3-methylbut-2-enyl-diphosphate synthase [Cytophagaceae bacterium]|nr:(E)-4-hydroxy-3-methylbut-2-enyl-diphosphate synthase [Cytophagaceae bacterium]
MKNNNTSFFCESLFRYKRNNTLEVRVGNLGFGGSNPVRVQSMTTTDTMDAQATAMQCISIAVAGGEMVRITTQGQREAANLAEIRKIISDKGCDFPLAADIHFNPTAATLAATLVEKVRINPGNFADGAKRLDDADFDEQNYKAGINNIRKKFVPFLETCKKYDRAIRIGVNHGSLSDRIMSRYGDTPEGMVESCMEYLRICREECFNRIVLSIKSSNTRVMVHTMRLLVVTMKKEGMNFPLHLGVTEAGSGEDGRIKSAVGIGALMLDGIGDTIRVSLTEAPENEIPVAKTIVQHFVAMENHPPIKAVLADSYHPYEYVKCQSHRVASIGGDQPPIVVADFRGRGMPSTFKTAPDAIIVSQPVDADILQIIPFNAVSELTPTVLPLYKREEINMIANAPAVLKLTYNGLNDEAVAFMKSHKDIIILLTTSHQNATAEQRAFFLAMNAFGLTHPVIVHREYNILSKEEFQIISATDVGALFLDGFGDGLLLHVPKINIEDCIETSFSILQASRVRFSRPEYISCPGCGRTLFDLQTTVETIRSKTSHLKNLKIAVMGCIVNGIGEMADADYGYVGAGAKKISLFRNREIIKKNIPEENAVEELVELIKQDGNWNEAIIERR